MLVRNTHDFISKSFYPNLTCISIFYLLLTMNLGVLKKKIDIVH